MTELKTNLCMHCMRPLDDAGTCPACGQVMARRVDPFCLQPGTIIDARYIAGALKHKNGESAEYIGYDAENERVVRIVEYFPSRLAVRAKNGFIMPMPGYEAQYKALFSEFVDICNTAKRFDGSGGVIPIENAVAANNTLYAVYGLSDAVKLEDYLVRSGGSIPLRRALKLFTPLCAVLDRLHKSGDIHRGVSPQTVYIGIDGKLYLWGFALGASRTEGSELDCELFSGYSAPEQYSILGRQGPWTDVYSIAALFYRTVSGIAPPKPIMAGSYRPATPLIELDGDIPASISAAVSRAMNPDPSRRTQTIAEFSSGLVMGKDFSSTATTAVFEIGSANPRPSGRDGARSDIFFKKGSESGVSVKYVILALFFTVLVLAGFMWFMLKEYLPDLIQPDPQEQSQYSQASLPSSDYSSSSEASQGSENSDTDKSVPRFVGLNAETVIADARYQNRFNFERRYDWSDSFASGVVYDQSPVEGTAMLNRGTVILYVSKGRLSITMPELTGMTVEEAKEILSGLGKDLDFEITFQIVERYELGVDPGNIVGSLPAPGTDFDPRERQIFIYVSLERQVNEASQQPVQPEWPNWEDLD